mgnify:FL=1
MFAVHGAAGRDAMRAERHRQQAIDGRRSVSEALSRLPAIAETAHGRAEAKAPDIIRARDPIADCEALTTILENAPAASAGQ